MTPVLEELDLRILHDQRRGGTVDGIPFLCLHGPLAVNSFADDVEDSSQHFSPDGNGNRRPFVDRLLTALQSIGGFHGDAPDGAFAYMLGNFEDEIFLPVVDGRVGKIYGPINRRKAVGRKTDVNHRSDNLYDLPHILGIHFCAPPLRALQRLDCWVGVSPSKKGGAERFIYPPASSLLRLALKRFRASHDVHHFVGDALLARFVVD